MEKSRSKETKLERSLADAIAKLERDHLKLQANDIKQDPDAKPTNANANTVMIAENKVKGIKPFIRCDDTRRVRLVC